jgi:hypothetical protein
MGAQVRFFMDKDDEAQFAEFVKKTGEVLFFVDPSPTSDFKPVAVLPEPHSVRFWSRVWLLNRTVSTKLLTKFVPRLEYYTIDGLRASVIEFDRTIRDGDILRPGRLWAEFRCANETATGWTPKEPEFRKWYESLARWIRKNYSREIDPDYYVGPSALRLIKEGNVQIKYF